VYDKTHFTAQFSAASRLWLLYGTYSAFLASWAEEAIMHLASAKFVDGAEPWRIWDRALKKRYVAAQASDALDTLEKEDWEDLGSVQYT
jgi:hypothetical protein